METMAEASALQGKVAVVTLLTDFGTRDPSVAATHYANALDDFTKAAGLHPPYQTHWAAEAAEARKKSADLRK